MAHARGCRTSSPEAPDVREAAPKVRHPRILETVAIDLRGLEPPQPMMRVLEAVERMRAGDRIEILLERRPVFLYPLLDERGVLHETVEPEPGLVRIVIRRAAQDRGEASQA